MSIKPDLRVLNFRVKTAARSLQIALLGAPPKMSAQSIDDRLLELRCQVACAKDFIDQAKRYIKAGNKL